MKSRKFLIMLVLLSFLSPLVAFAETNKESPDVNKDMITETIIEEEKQDEEKKTEKLVEQGKSDTPVIENETATSATEILSNRAFDLSNLTVDYVKGDKPSAVDFYNLAKDNDSVKLYEVASFTFENDVIPSTEITGKFENKVRLFGQGNDGKVNIYTMSYSVRNTVATLKITDLKHDSVKKVITGKTTPLGIVTVYSNKDMSVILGQATADSSGYFEVPGNFKVGVTYYLRVVSKDNELNDFSDIVTLVIPEVTVESDKKETLAPVIKVDDKKKLPQTGEKDRVGILITGLFSLGIAGILLTRRYF